MKISIFTSTYRLYVRMENAVISERGMPMWMRSICSRGLWYVPRDECKRSRRMFRHFRDAKNSLLFFLTFLCRLLNGARLSRKPARQKERERERVLERGDGTKSQKKCARFDRYIFVYFSHRAVCTRSIFHPFFFSFLNIHIFFHSFSLDSNPVVRVWG